MYFLDYWYDIMKKRCWICGKKILFTNRYLCFNVTNVTGCPNQNVRDTEIRVCKKCAPILWRDVNVSFPADLIKARIDSVNFMGGEDE